jgi:outer membrane biosynthesis protein TonB
MSKPVIFCVSCGLALAGWGTSETHGQAPATKTTTLSKADAFEPPKLIQSTPPEYPSLARQMEKSGTVTIAVVVGTRRR